MISELIWFGLGILIGFMLSTKERRKQAMSKLNEWTKPKKEDAPKEPPKA